MPIIRGPDKGKLSKRHGATSLRAYGEEGYLPEALLNFMALLGWSKDESTTIMSRDEIRDAFSIDGLGLASAMFDVERLREMNARYIRNLAADDFLERGRPWLEAAIGRPLDLAPLLPLAGAIQERVKLLPRNRRLRRLLLHRRSARLRQRRADGPRLPRQALGRARGH